MVQLVRKTMMVGAMPNYYAKRKYSMRPKEDKLEKPDDVKEVAADANGTNEAVEKKEEPTAAES
ncbi:unnamed protein product [Cylicostephanus goldi]|uniref:Uncharacterized protein n=1 Tax=Cylicostephanus goldi TaxID=71465 RepID=A0A3P6T6L9_CYLGO|nr:unnamed protein product [Cylicostephanus goldi]